MGAAHEVHVDPPPTGSTDSWLKGKSEAPQRRKKKLTSAHPRSDILGPKHASPNSARECRRPAAKVTRPACPKVSVKHPREKLRNSILAHRLPISVFCAWLSQALDQVLELLLTALRFHSAMSCLDPPYCILNTDVV